MVSELRPLIFKGRGTASNGVGRFESLTREVEDDGWGNQDEAPPPLKTEVLEDTSRSIISWNTSPDIPFDRSINPYRGCEHGCVYCYARPSHAYLGYSPGLDFESRILAKPDAAKLLVKELSKPGYRCEVMAIGGNTDCYQPVERKLNITRSILQVLSDFKHPLALVTKSALVERDMDILAPMALQGLVKIYVTLTTLDRTLARHLEPRAAAPQRRLETIRRLAEADIPVGVMFAPVIPALNDTEMESVLEAAKEAGAKNAHYVMLRLPHELDELFTDWLHQHVPLRANHVLSLLRQSRGDKMNDARFHHRMKGQGLFADMISQRFKLAVKRLNLQERSLLDTSKFRVPITQTSTPQLSLF